MIANECKGGMIANERGASLGDGENVSVLNSNDGCTTVWIY